MAGRTTGAYNVNNRFTDGNMELGQLPTVIDAAWLNDKQEELVRLVEAAGITPSLDKQSQVLCAIRYFLVTGNGYGLSYGAPSVRNLYQSGVLFNPLNLTLSWARPNAADGAFDSGFFVFTIPVGARITRIRLYGYTLATDGTVAIDVQRLNLTTGALDYMGGVGLQAGEIEDSFVPSSSFSTVAPGYSYVATLSCKASVSVNNATFYGLKLELAYP